MWIRDGLMKSDAKCAQATHFARCHHAFFPICDRQIMGLPNDEFHDPRSGISTSSKNIIRPMKNSVFQLAEPL